MLQPGFYISLSASPRSDRFLLDLSLLAARVQLCQLCRHVAVGPAELWIPALFPPARCWRPAGLRPCCFPHCWSPSLSVWAELLSCLCWCHHHSPVAPCVPLLKVTQLYSVVVFSVIFLRCTDRWSRGDDLMVLPLPCGPGSFLKVEPRPGLLTFVST